MCSKQTKKLNSSGLMSFFSGSSRQEEACDLYTRAANAYKMSKKWKEAGDCFSKVAELQAGLEHNKHESATSFQSAATCYKKCDPNAAIKALHSAIDLLTDNGRFRIAAKLQMEIAELYETELVDLEKAVEAYSLAADWFSSEEGSSPNKALLKVAQFSAQLGQYERAIEIYEKVGTEAIDNKLLKWGAKEYFLKAGLCRICTGDVLTARRSAERYKEQFPSFQDTREAKFLSDILTACEEEEVGEFTNVVAEYDSMTRLDPWMSSILLQIKNSIGEEDADYT